MFKILYDQENKKVQISFYCSDQLTFQSVGNILHKFRYQFDKDKKLWQGSPKVFEDLSYELEEYGDIWIHPYVDNLIKKDCVVPINIKKYRSNFDPLLLKYPPLIGKHPYENYQSDDIKLMLSYNRFGCFWSTGTGKSYPISYIIVELLRSNRINHTLLIAPPDGLINIKREILKFSHDFKEEDFLLINRFNKEVLLTVDHQSYKILLCTYSTWLVLNNFFYIETKLKGKRKRSDQGLIELSKKEIRKKIPDKFESPVIDFNKWWGENNKLIILDESHNIANFESKTSHYIHLYKNFFHYRYIFTATPWDQYHKMYSQMTFLDDSLIPKKYKEWLLEVANIGTQYSASAVSKYKEDKINNYIEKCAPYFIRRLKKDVLDLPPNQIIRNYVEMNSIQQEIYEGIVNYTLYELSQKKGEISSNDLFNQFPYLIQVLDNPCLLKGKLEKKGCENNKLLSLINNWKFEDHPKLEVTDYLLNKYIREENRKVILWDIHPQSINQLVEYYKKYNPIFIHGQIEDLNDKDKVKYRDDLVQKFKYDKNCYLFILSELVIKNAITMTECNRQIYFVRNFTYVDYEQSSNRIYRQGSEEEVKTHIILHDKSLDLQQDRILEQKDDINKLKVNKKYLSKDEIKDIFTGKEFIFNEIENK